MDTLWRTAFLCVFICSTTACSTLQENASPNHITLSGTESGASITSKSQQVQSRNAKTEKQDRQENSRLLWQRIKNGFALDINRYSNQRTRQAIDRYVRYHEHFEKNIENARPYLHYVVEELSKRNMPLELALLPVIESAYKPTALSPKKAVGLWQFMPATGKLYGLKQNWWYDGRLDVSASTDAALDYLQRLHRQMDGDWLKALAAYNCGEGRLARAERKNIELGKPTDFWSLDLPRETRNYVPKLLAISTIVANAEKYSVQLPEIEDKPYLAEVHTGSQIELSLAAEIAGMPASKLRYLNPGFRRWATDPKGPHRLLLPADKVEHFNRRLSAISPDKRVPSLKNGKILQYRIRKGDTLSRIAKTYGTSVRALCSMNNIGKHQVLRPGKDLVVPAGQNDIPAYVASNNTAGKNPHNAKVIKHKVRRGETLGHIADRYNVSVATLTRANRIGKRSTLSIGQKLLIPKKKEYLALLSKASTGKHQSKKSQSKQHKIRKGETLWDIARYYSTTVNSLRNINGLSKNAMLKIGAILLVP